MKKHIGLIIFIVIIIALILVAYLPNDEDKYLQEVSMSEVTKKINNKDSFILYVKQTDCTHCKAFTPNFASVLKDTKTKAYVLNVTNLSDDDRKIYDSTINADGTPTVFFYTDGEKSMITLEGEQGKDKIKSVLKTAGFVKKEK